MRPRDFVGVEYLVKVTTSKGEVARWIVGLDREDALAQVLAYCEAEGLIPVSSAVL